MTADEIRAAIVAEKDAAKKADLQTQLREMGAAVPGSLTLPVMKSRY